MMSVKLRVILRNKKSGLYYASRNRWVADPTCALDFDDIEHVGRLAFEEDVTQLEVVLANGDSTREWVLPMRRARRGEPAARVAA